MKSKSRREENIVKKYYFLFDNSNFIVLILAWGILRIIKLTNRKK